MAGMRPGHEGAVVAVQIDRRAAECLAPVGGRTIEMRMRHRDRLQPAERAHMGDGLVGPERNAIPHHAAIRLAQKQRALPDCEGWLDRDADDIEIVAPDKLVSLREVLAREPALAGPVHELPLILADRARARRLETVGKLCATLEAGPEGHEANLVIVRDDKKCRGTRAGRFLSNNRYHAVRVPAFAGTTAEMVAAIAHMKFHLVSGRSCNVI
jgi:hypothetical protein